MHFLEWKKYISIEISLKFVPKGPINNIPALVQIMAWRRSGDKPLSEPMMASPGLIYWHIYASLCLNELNHISQLIIRQDTDYQFIIFSSSEFSQYASFQSQWMILNVYMFIQEYTELIP